MKCTVQQQIPSLCNLMNSFQMQNVVSFSCRCTWCRTSHTVAEQTIIPDKNEKHTSFVQKQSCEKLSNILHYSDPPPKFNSEPAFVEIPYSAVLSDGKPMIAGTRQTFVTCNVRCDDSFKAVYSDDASLLLSCRFS